VFTLAVALAPAAFAWFTPPAPVSATGLTGHYYTNNNWRGEPTKVRVDPEINFDWWGKPPLLPAFSVEWTGTIRVGKEGLHQFRVETADGVTIDIGNTALIATGGAASVVSNTAQISLRPGDHRIRIRYYNEAGDSIIRLYWTPPGGAEEIVPSEVFFPKVG
jgi:hypothetical protein